MWGDAFVAQPREKVPALLGGGADVLMPAAGLVIIGGEGGAGKSTLTLHALAHLASGTDWFGIPIERPLRVGVIENEGPKAPYIDKLERFADSWDGPDFLPNVAFLDSPWGRFSLADEQLRAEIRAFTVEAQLDLVIAGPLGRLGVAGAGSPEETRAFMDPLAEVGCQRDVAWWLIHHVGKQKQRSIVQQLSSGDWGGHPDLILGLEDEGKRRSKLTFGKVRWGDQGRASLLLEWLPEDEGIATGSSKRARAPRSIGSTFKNGLSTLCDQPGRVAAEDRGAGRGQSHARPRSHPPARARGAAD